MNAETFQKEIAPELNKLQQERKVSGAYKAPADDSPLSAAKLQIALSSQFREAHQQLKELRSSSLKGPALDISLGEYIQLRYGYDYNKETGLPGDAFFKDLGFEFGTPRLESFFTTGETDGLRWLIPEIYREAINLGLRRAAMYTDWIMATESISQTQLFMPFVNLSDAGAWRMNEGESVKMGTTTFNQRPVKIYKYGRGIKITDEVANYVALNMLSLFMADMGRVLSYQKEGMALDVLVNGDQTDGSQAAAVIGVDNTTNGIVYKDLMRTMIRMSRLGMRDMRFIVGEETGLDVQLLDEFRTSFANNGPERRLNVMTPLPTTIPMYYHGATPADQLIVLDRTRALIELVARAVLVETDRDILTQTTDLVATTTVGFVNMFADGRVIIDGSEAYSGNGFPAYMDIDAYESATILGA